MRSSTLSDPALIIDANSSSSSFSSWVLFVHVPDFSSSFICMVLYDMVWHVRVFGGGWGRGGWQFMLIYLTTHVLVLWYGVARAHTTCRNTVFWLEARSRGVAPRSSLSHHQESIIHFLPDPFCNRHLSTTPPPPPQNARAGKVNPNSRHELPGRVRCLGCCARVSGRVPPAAGRDQWWRWFRSERGGVAASDRSHL